MQSAAKHLFSLHTREEMFLSETNETSIKALTHARRRLNVFLRAHKKLFLIKKASNNEKNKRYIHPHSTILHPTVHRL